MINNPKDIEKVKQEIRNIDKETLEKAIKAVEGGSMSKEFEYYVILFNNNLTYLTDDGYPSANINHARQYTNLTVAKQEVEDLDGDYKEYAVIYKVTETRTYEVEKEGK